MKKGKPFCNALALVASCGMLIPLPCRTVLAVEAIPVTAQRTVADGVAVTDIALGVDNELFGRVLDNQGNPLAGSNVVVATGTEIVASPVTNRAGEFAVKRLRGGKYQINSAGGGTSVRLWAAGTAPPNATDHVTVMAGVKRGQGCTTSGCASPATCGGCAGGGGKSPFGFLLHPFVIGAAVAAAIAIPLALDDDDDAS